MERDCQIACGAAEFLKDRLLRNSDDFEMVICEECGAIASTQTCCKGCNTDNVSRINVPFVFKLVQLELGGMNIKMKITAGS